MFEQRFHNADLRRFIGYSRTYSMAIQSVMRKSSASPHLRWSGEGAVFINGVFVPSLAQAATITMSSSAIAPGLAGKRIVSGDTQYMVVFAMADGTPKVVEAGIGTLFVPEYDYTRFCPVGIVKYYNDSGSEVIIGTTNLDEDDCVIYQVVGPLYPHNMK